MHGLTVIAWISVAGGVVAAAVIALDIARGRTQHMWIMNVVWPLTALYSGPLGLWAYFRIGRAPLPAQRRSSANGASHEHSRARAFWQSAVLGTTHCGAGCTLGDIIAEWAAFFFPLQLLGRSLFGTWAIDFVAAFLLGIAFQYFAIKPMKNVSRWRALRMALKADSASLTAWQLGMYGWMALAIFAIFGHELPKTEPVFWFMMQVAMLAGFLTAYPVNCWLIRAGIKERM